MLHVIRNRNDKRYHLKTKSEILIDDDDDDDDDDDCVDENVNNYDNILQQVDKKHIESYDNNLAFEVQDEHDHYHHHHHHHLEVLQVIINDCIHIYTVDIIRELFYEMLTILECMRKPKIDGQTRVWSGLFEFFAKLASLSFEILLKTQTREFEFGAMNLSLSVS